MPTIRIDQDVFEGLQKLAEPFVDSPGSVIRRLLIEKGVVSTIQKKPVPRTAPRQNGPAPAPPSLKLTAQSVYEEFLMTTLDQRFSGGGDKRSVTRAVLERMVRQGHIGPADLELVATGETKAENTITWARNALKNRGMISRASRRGIWELTAEGREAARALG